MIIAVIGTGAVGSIYGGRLVLKNEVFLVDTSEAIVDAVKHNGLVLEENGQDNNRGKGNTNVGMLVAGKEGLLPKLKDALASCGFKVRLHENIQQLIYNKLFVNVAFSAVTGLLKCEMSFIARNDYAMALSKMLLHDTVSVAHALGLEADEEPYLTRSNQYPQISLTA
mgnify:CR=1 FL=1